MYSYISIASNIFYSFLDYIFPIECVGCGEEIHTPVVNRWKSSRDEARDKQEGKWLCERCFFKIKFNDKQICPLCGRFLKLGYSCVCGIKLVSSIKHQASGNVDVYITFVNLKENPQVEKLIHLLKYNFIESAADDLAKIAVEFFKKKKFRILEIKTLMEDGEVVFIPVPLHRKRLLWRGFNQSELILNRIKNSESKIKNGERNAQLFNCPFVKEQKNDCGNKLTGRLNIRTDLLIRRKNTDFQGKAKMREIDRRENMKSAFEAINRELVIGKKIILFDDVITTGSTMEECAQALKAAGARKVIAVAVGKG